MMEYDISIWDVTDSPDTKQWGGAHIVVRCMPYDSKRLSGAWLTDQDDVFGFGTGHNGWYRWEPKVGTLYLYRPDPNSLNAPLSLARFFNMDLTNGTIGRGLCHIPPPPAKGKQVVLHWELALKPAEPPPDPDEENDKNHAHEAWGHCIEIRQAIDKPKVQEEHLKAARKEADQIKNQDMKKRVEDEIEYVVSTSMRKVNKK